MTGKLLPAAQLIADRLAREFPELAWNIGASESGELEMSVAAPDGSAAGALIVITQEGDTWVRFAPPRLFYAVEDVPELLSVVRGLISRELAFRRTFDSDGSWLGTTLVGNAGLDRSEIGEHEVVVEW